MTRGVLRGDDEEDWQVNTTDGGLSRMMVDQSKEVVTGNDDEEDWQATMTEDGSHIDVMNPPVEHGMAPRMTGVTSLKELCW